ncbi:MAG: deoxyribonuclease IV [Anaerolineae bacterium]
MSIAGEPANALRAGARIGCDTIQMFTRSPNRWSGPPLSDQQVQSFHAVRSATGIEPVIAHSAYLINLASPDEALLTRSLDLAADELERVSRLAIDGYVLHPGAHTGAGELPGLERIARALTMLLADPRSGSSRILLETTSGAGTHLGYRLEHLAWLLAHVDAGAERLGVCIDTAHLFGAGYSLTSAADYGSFWAEFEALITLPRLGAIHLNDSKKALGSRGDRHEQLGEGLIGVEAFYRLVNDARLQQVPMILETPKSDDLHEDVRNLALLRELVGMYREQAGTE